MSVSTSIAVGTLIYDSTINRIPYSGRTFTDVELDAAIHDRLLEILHDDPGHVRLLDSLASLSSTGFDDDRLKEILRHEPDFKDWQVGEALAEAFLTDHRNCEFPWPTVRDLKNPDASAAGTDLVGFSHTDNVTRFAFGEVKTSREERWPPQVVTGKHGLAKQLEDLRDSATIKRNLVKYMGHHAQQGSWWSVYQNATGRYLADETDVVLFGVLVRDVKPSNQDLSGRASSLSQNCPSATAIELFALYLPVGVIPTLPSKVKTARAAR
jgi:hypothetical protein